MITMCELKNPITNEEIVEKLSSVLPVEMLMEGRFTLSNPEQGHGDGKGLIALRVDRNMFVFYNDTVGAEYLPQFLAKLQEIAT